MSSNAEALCNLLKAIDPNAEIPAGGNTAAIINAIADAIRAKNGKRAAKK